MRGKSIFPNRNDSRGIAALEFALIAPVLSVILVGTADLGMACWEKVAVNNAAWAGAAYAAIHGSSNTSGISNAVSQATGLTSIQASLPLTTFTGCPTLSGVISPPTGNCTANTYMWITASTQYTLMLPYPGFSNPMTITSKVLVRVQ
ncbi:MAG: pilus assembly protein [Acetobacteraceae bacterium]|nr:pilus assembly protein [Acetobacteraceae bacterium]